MSEETAVQENTKPPVEILSYRMVGELAPLFEAIAKATLEFEPIQKDRHVKIQTKDRGSYEFDYATLEEVLRCTTPALAKNGLKLWHFLCDAADGAREIHHMLTHASGAYIETVQVVRLKEGDGWQQFGSAITYARRYQVQCLLGVSAEFDDDGNAADGNTVAAARDRSKAPTPKAQPKAPPPEKTLPKSEPPPPPERQVVDDEPCSPATLAQIKKFMLALNIQRTEKIAMMKSVLGKSPEEQPTEDDGQKMLAHLRNMAEADGVVVE